MNEDIAKKIRQLQTNFTAIESIIDFCDSLKGRRLINSREVEETRLRVKYAKEQVMDLALKNKKLLLSIEKQEIP